MNIIVCVKQVPDTEARIKCKDGANGIVRDGIKLCMSPYDEFALEAALRLKEQHGGTVTVLAVGPDRAKEVLKTGLAVGADKAVLVSDASLAGTDGRGVAVTLAAALKKLPHDLVLFGKKAVGVDRGQVGPQVAHRLDLPFVSQAGELAHENGAMRVVREIEGGQEHFEVALPAMLSVDKTANELRKASLKGIMGAKSKPIQAWSLSDLGLSAADVAPRLQVVHTEHPPQRGAGRIIDGEAVAAARELVRLLREEAKVI